MTSHQPPAALGYTNDGHGPAPGDRGELQPKNTRRPSRSMSAGNEAGLTELAIPPPVEEVEDNGDSYEMEEQRINRISRARRRGGEDEEEEEEDDDDDEGEEDDDDDNKLTELAVPAPVSHSGGSQVHHDVSLDVGSPNTQTTSPAPGVDEEKGGQVAKASAFFAELCIVSWLVFFSILGTLARLGVQAISTYPNAPFSSPVLWANLGGSLFLGFLLEDRRFFRYSVENEFDSHDDLYSEIDRVKKTLPLYIGLATGFCGSFTSFSTFITDVFLALANAFLPPSPTHPFQVAPWPVQARNGGYSFMAALGMLIVQIAVSLGGLKAGAHMAIAVEPAFPSISTTILHRVLDPLSIPLGWGCWLGAVALAIWPPHDVWRNRVTAALAFAPLGVILRFYLARSLNARIPAFPLGTFTANMVGTIIEGICMDLQHSSGVRALSCEILQGVMFGFSGCVTTVSTWVAELDGLRRKHAWIYGLASVSIALGFQVIIMGSMLWTVGYSQQCAA